MLSGDLKHMRLVVELSAPSLEAQLVASVIDINHEMFMSHLIVGPPHPTPQRGHSFLHVQKAEVGAECDGTCECGSGTTAFTSGPRLS